MVRVLGLMKIPLSAAVVGGAKTVNIDEGLRSFPLFFNCPLRLHLLCNQTIGFRIQIQRTRISLSRIGNKELELVNNGFFQGFES